MIQTQLLKCDKPYQIISAAGMVGIQVATLIVTEDKVDKDGNYMIDTHSHPVVNYACKDGLVEELKYYDGNPEYEYKYTQRLQPEGAVWNKVEVRDIRVLGLVGAVNLLVDLEQFVVLVPQIPNDHLIDNYWDETTPQKITNLRYSMERAGLAFGKCHSSSFAEDFNHERLIYLELHDADDGITRYVSVKITEGDMDMFPYKYPVQFSCRIDAEPLVLIDTIGKCVARLANTFDFPKIRFSYRSYTANNDGEEWLPLLKKLTHQLNENWDSYLTSY